MRPSMRLLPTTLGRKIITSGRTLAAVSAPSSAGAFQLTLYLIRWDGTERLRVHPDRWFAAGTWSTRFRGRRRWRGEPPPKDLHNSNLGRVFGATSEQQRPNTREDQASSGTRRRSQASRSTTLYGLQNLHPRFKSGRRLHFSAEISSVPAGACLAGHSLLLRRALDSLLGSVARLPQVIALRRVVGERSA